jgi:hypothetical protein
MEFSSDQILLLDAKVDRIVFEHNEPEDRVGQANNEWRAQDDSPVACRYHLIWVCW